VGATLAAVFLAAAVAWVWRRKRRQRAPPVVAGPTVAGMGPENAAMWEKQPPTELNAGYYPAELHTPGTAAELPESLRTAPSSHMSGYTAHQ
jgi:hypothetical protein